MPTYSQNSGPNNFERIDLPQSLNHVSQFLWQVSPGVWDEIRAQARALQARPRGVKIKPRSYTKLLSVREAHHLIPHIMREHYEHSNHKINAHWFKIWVRQTSYVRVIQTPAERNQKRAALSLRVQIDLAEMEEMLGRMRWIRWLRGPS